MKVSVIGGRGYMGGELLRLLIEHPGVQIVDVTSTSVSSEPLTRHFPHLLGLTDLVFSEYEPDAISGEIVFLAMPHTLSMEIAAEMRSRGKRVIDLSGDYRLRDSIVYEQWYGVKHNYPELLDEAVYGLPELHRRVIADAGLVASPGCYPTGIILGAAPLLKNRPKGITAIIADSVSGVSGAGRALSPSFHFPEMNEEMFAYKAFSHRHTPEISQELCGLYGGYIPLTFTPHVASFTRGIYSTIYICGGIDMAIEDIRSVYLEFYKDEPFVHVMDAGEYPKLGSVSGSNYCHISIFRDDSGMVLIFSVIDNLLKGGAGQAVQSMNIMIGADEKTGLISAPPFP